MITLPANVFDILDTSVSTFGIRAGRYFVFAAIGDELSPPGCFVGHWDYCFGNVTGPRELYGISEGTSDRAVYAINKRKHVHPTRPVTWTEFIAQMGILRGPDKTCDLSAHESSMKHEEREVPNASRMERQSLA